MTLKQILDSLPEEQRRLLFYSFEHSIPQFVDLGNKRYIGVYTSKIPYLIPDLELTRGVWSSGEIKS